MKTAEELLQFIEWINQNFDWNGIVYLSADTADEYSELELITMYLNRVRDN